MGLMHTGTNATAAVQKAALDVDVLVNTVVQSLIFVGIGLIVFAIAFLLIAKVSPFSIRKEIEDDQNTALGLVLGAVIIGLAHLCFNILGIAVFYPLRAIPIWMAEKVGTLAARTKISSAAVIIVYGVLHIIPILYLIL